MIDIQQQLRAAFDAELAEHLSAIRAELDRADTGAEPDLRDIFRRAHSLKGAARAVELPAVETLAHHLESALAEVEQGRAPIDPAAVRRALDAIEDAVHPPPPSDAPDASPADARPALLRVSGDHVERLGRSVSALGAALQSRGDPADALVALRDTLQALRRDHARGADIAAGLGDAATQAARLVRANLDADLAVERAAAVLESDAAAIMLVPAATLFDGFERVVRDVAEAQGKSAALVVTGGELEVDRRVLQALRDPVLHGLRNAVTHGIEAGAARRGAAKPPLGRIVLAAATADGQLILSITDDGAGLDDARIAAHARQAGLIAPGEAPPPAAALRALLFEQGLSTADTVDRLAGRGVGLSVVADAARNLQGIATIDNAPGGGTRLAIRVPLALARQPVLLLEAGGVTYGVPASAIVHLMRIDPEAILRSEGVRQLMLDGEAIPVVPLTRLLDPGAAIADAPDALALLLRGAGGRIVFTVDALDSVRPLTVGDTSAMAVAAPLVAGVLMLEDARVALLLAPDALVDRVLRDRRRLAAPGEDAPIAAAPRYVQTILVVDDSLTTRTLERTILEAHGYRVLMSVDGLDGLQRLRRDIDLVDLVIADVEMPRMDGFGLLAAIRNDPTLANIPVVMMTSRNSPEDVRRGLDLGANAYVTKQDFDQGRLLATIAQLL